VSGLVSEMREKCRACGAEAPAGDLCPECGRLQPFPAGADHWAVLGLERTLGLDRTDLERRFHALNRRFHPDYFRLRSPEEQATSLEDSAAVNTAYRALRDPIGRVEYLLALEGMALGTAGQARPPADLFEEIMDLQEARQDLEAAGGQDPALRERLTAARADLEARRAATQAELVALFPGWDAADPAERRALLGRMRDIVATRAYLGTILRDLGAALDGPPDAGRTA
jgi:molecular chaperone HscB